MKAFSKLEWDYVTKIFQIEISLIGANLKTVLSEQDRATLINRIAAIKTAQKLLNKCFEYEIKPNATWRRIPMPQHQFSEYRLVEDFDTDNQGDWQEISDIRPIGSSVLIE